MSLKSGIDGAWELMSTVAFIGGDGAGKTTIANAVIQSSGLPMKYLYMGLSTRSSNLALPTSRLVLFLKQRRYKKKKQKSTSSSPDEMPTSELEYSENTHGWVWNTARFLNRLAEAWYRQLISTIYQMRGYVVIYDRHFFFDTAPGIINSQEQSLLLLDRLYFWLMCHWYPRPTLTIFLDAPSELLYRRKGEATPEYLEQQRGVFLKQGEKLPHFFRVDATQPLDKVLSEVIHHIQVFFSHRYHHRPGSQKRKVSKEK
jgi:thymidylate kinase